MAMNGMSFCRDIGQVLNAGIPEYFEMSSSDAILDLLISHRGELGSSDSDGFVRSLGRCTVFSPGLCFHLREPKVGEDILDKVHALSVAMRRAVYSASAADDKTIGRILEMDPNPPLIWLFPLVCFLPRK